LRLKRKLIRNPPEPRAARVCGVGGKPDVARAAFCRAERPGPDHSAASRRTSVDSGPLWRKPHVFSHAAIHRLVRRMPPSSARKVGDGAPCPSPQAPPRKPPCFLSGGTSVCSAERKMTGFGLVPFVPPLLRGGMAGFGLVPRLRYQVRRLMPSASHGFARDSEFAS
jgi:hypothetical protein